MQSFTMTTLNEKTQDVSTMSGSLETSQNYAYIEEVLTILDTKTWKTLEEFIEPWGQEKVTLIHLAAYIGQLELLKRAHSLGVDLFLTDKLKRCALHYAARQGHVGVVKWLVEQSPHHSQLELKDKFGITALHLAVEAKHVDVVKFLVDSNVDVNIRDKEEMTPLHLAWVNVDRENPEEIMRYENIVDVLLSSSVFKKIVDSPVGASRTMMLNCAVWLNSLDATTQLLERGLLVPDDQHQIHGITTSLHVAADHGFHRALSTLLRYDEFTSWMINMRDELGQTPLHIAVSQGRLKCAKILVKSKGNLASEDENGLTVMDALFRYNEDPMVFLTDILDAEVDTKERNSHIVRLNFEVLAPQGNRQMDVVSALIGAAPNIKQMNILQHPLVEVFLGLKWIRLRYFFLIIVFFHALFFTCLFIYGIILLQERCDLPAPRRILFVCACVLICHNILQLVMVPKYYMKKFEIWLSMLCATICVIIAVVGEFSPNSIEVAPSEVLDQPSHRGRARSWVLQSISVAILFACIQVMLIVGQFPTWGYYGLMFTTVLRNVLKVFLAVVWVIVGFSLSFAILFHGNNQFNNPWKAFAKTVVMMTGEYDYGELFALTDKNNFTDDKLNSDENQTDLRPITGRIVFLVFVMLASIVLMNLMIGMAVTDVQALLNEGLTHRLVKQVEFVSHLEQITSHWILQCWLMPRCLSKLFESRNTIPTQLDLGLSPRYGKPPFGISKRLIEKLCDLASKNRNLRQKFQTTSSHDKIEDSLIETILFLQKEVEKLQREKCRELKCNPRNASSKST